MKYLYVIVTAVLAVVLGISTRRAMAQPISCSSGYLDNPQNRKFCAALATLYAGIPNGIESYSDEIRSNPAAFGIPVAAYKGRIAASDFIENNLPFVDRGTKRQDVDHVFLRFGRRR